jgi:hypothetical protein
MPLIETQTLKQPDQKRSDAFAWFTLSLTFLSAMDNMARLAKAHPHRPLTWICIALLTGASISFFVRTIHSPTDINTRISLASSVCAMLFGPVSWMHLF